MGPSHALIAEHFVLDVLEHDTEGRPSEVIALWLRCTSPEVVSFEEGRAAVYVDDDGVRRLRFHDDFVNHDRYDLASEDAKAADRTASTRPKRW